MRKYYIKRRYLFAICCCILIFAIAIIVVAGKPGKKKSEQKAATNKGTSTKEISKNVLTWAIPENLSMSNEKLERFNQKLYEEGYDFAVAFETVSYEDPYSTPEYMKGEKVDCNVYRDELEKLLKDKKVDIVYGGMGYEQAVPQTDALCRKGYFYSLNEYLSSNEGKKLYDRYDEELWKSRSIDGNIFMLPHEEFYSWSFGTSFNLKYVPKNLAESWDGTLAGLLKILEQITIPEQIIPFAAPLSVTSLVEELGWEEHWGLYYDVESQTVGNPYDSQEYKELLSTLHTMYQKGYIPEWTYMDDDEVTEEILEQKKNKQYVIGDENLSAASKELYVVEDAAFVVNTLSDGTMISKDSRYVQEALELLTLLHTEDKWANLFILGQEGTDYKVSKEFVVPLTSKESDISVAKTVFGLKEGLKRLQGESDIKNHEEVKEYFASEKRRYSKVLGFQADVTGMEEEFEKFTEISKHYKDCWREEDFEKAYAKAKKATDKASKNLIRQIQKQMDRWKAQ